MDDAPLSDDHSAAPCPRCGEALGDPDIGREIKRSGRPCSGLHGCGGVWYRHSTFELMKKEAQEAGSLDPGGDSSPSAAFPGPADAPKIDCPECAAPMDQRHFRFEGRATPIVLDDCRAHGIWFDAEEFEAALHVVRAHAQAMARHQEEGRDPKPSQNSKPDRGPSRKSKAAAEYRREREKGTVMPSAVKRSASRKRRAAADAAEIFADVTLGAIFAILFDD